MTFNNTGPLSGDQISALSTVYLVSLSPSLIGSFSVLVVSIARWKHLQEQVQPLVQLALADLLAALILMFTSAMNKVGSFDISRVAICEHALPLSLTFYFVSFLLVVVYAWKSKNAVQGWRAEKREDEGGQSPCRRRMVVEPNIIYPLVWLVPIALYFAYVLTPYLTTALVFPSNEGRVGVAFDYTLYCNSCILFLHIWWDPCSDDEEYHDIFIRYFLFFAVIPALVSCSVIYYKVGKWYHRYEQDGLFPVEGDGLSRRRLKRVFSTAHYMIVVILVCWTPALILVIMSTLMKSTNIEQQNFFFLYIIQAVTMSLQGFLNSVVYAWRRPNFREAVLGESTPLIMYNRQAFFDESLRFSP